MYYYKDRHSKQSKYAVKRRKKVNSIAITISNFTVTVMAIWLMMVASIIGLMNTTLVPKEDIIDPLKIGSKYRHTAVVATHVSTTSFMATPINTITTTNPIEEEKMILPMSEEAELEYEAELAAELIASSEEAQQIEEVQHQPVIEETTTQLTDSTKAIGDSIKTLQGFSENFDNLTGHFGSLYQDIEEQNTNIQQVESIFEDLKHKISEMTDLSEENQNSVMSITDTINVYKENMEMVIDDNKNINEVSKAMLELADTQDMI